MQEDQARDAVRAYHQASKHGTEAYAPSPGFLDWDSQPDPFRRFEGAPLIPLPLVEDAGFNASDTYEPPPTLERLGLFLELALGLSAWKSLGPDRWALRNNPSSGNLHPTEAYLLLWQTGVARLPPGLYHYRPDVHALEQRALLPAAVAAQVAKTAPGTWGALGLSSVIWREEWKYGSRAYRYCQLDVGHALGAARFAAGVVGWRLTMDAMPGDVTVANCLGLDRPADFAEVEAEHPDLLAPIGAPTSETAIPWARIALELTQWSGAASRLSEESVRWPQIARVLPAMVKSDGAASKAEAPSCEPKEKTFEGVAYVDLIRRRRSAQRMDGKTGIGRAAFERLLTRVVPGTAPFDALPFTPAVDLILFAHAVEGLEPGLYFLSRTADVSSLRSAPSRLHGWDVPLYALSAQPEVRKLASQLCCYQGIAGRGAFSLAMVADFDNTLAKEGGWAYRRLHWECGLIGQRLYLEAEAAGLRGTGIGCFFDDAVRQLAGIADGWQALYHFTVGRALEDKRLTNEPPYAQRGSGGGLP